MNRNESPAQSMFYLKLFGSPTLSQGGAALGGRAAQRHRVALLAMLAVAGPRGIGRERLMATLWPETGPARARNLLKVSVYELRRALGADAILSDGDYLRLNPERVESDVGEFEEALASSDNARAAALHDGPFLDGLFLKKAPTFDRWVDGERERLARAHLRALEALGEAAEERGDLQEASEWWGSAAAWNPYDSRLALRLMGVLEAMGNRGGALRHAEAHERALGADLGVAPSPDVTSFLERLRVRAQVGEEPPAPAPSEAQADPHGAAEPPFRLRTLGALALHGPDGSVTAASKEDELGLTLLAVLAGVGAQDLPRDTLLLYFWPELPWREADAALDDVLQRIRGWTQKGAVVGTDPIALNRSVIGSDLAELEQAARLGSPDVVLSLTRNDLLEGAPHEPSPELEAWIQAQRHRVDALRADAAERAARTADRGVTRPPAATARPARRWMRAQTLGYLAAAASLVILTAYAVTSARPSRPMLSRETTSNSAARDLLDQANTPARFRNDSLALVSLDLLHRAIKLDSTFAGAHAELASMYLRLSPLPGISRNEGIARAEYHARTAVALAPSLGRAHSALGGVLLRAYDFEAAEEALSRALELDPSFAITHQLIVHSRVFQGRFQEALTRALVGHQKDPASSSLISEVARGYLVNGRCDQTHVWLDKLRDVEPPVLFSYALRAECLVQEGRWEEAIEVLRKGVPSGGPRMLAHFGFVLAQAARSGAAVGLPATTLALWEAEARGILGTLTAGLGHRATSFDLGTVLLGLGEVDVAFDWFEQAVDDRTLQFEIMQPRYRELHAHPRFQTLLEGLGVPRR